MGEASLGQNPHLPALPCGWPDGGGGRLQGVSRATVNTGTTVPVPDAVKIATSQPQEAFLEPAVCASSPGRVTGLTMPTSTQWKPVPPLWPQNSFLPLLHSDSQSLSPIPKTYPVGVKLGYWTQETLGIPEYFKQAPFSVWATILISVKRHRCCALFSIIVRLDAMVALRRTAQGLWVSVLTKQPQNCSEVKILRT